MDMRCSDMSETSERRARVPRRDGLRVGVVAAALAMSIAGCATTGAGGASAVAAPAGAGTAQTAASPANAPGPATHAARPEQALPPPTALESQAGIQVAHIGATASGGLVDARFRVLDAAKAATLLRDPANAPMLLAGDRPPLMPPHHALKGARFAKDQVFFVLYPNTRGAIQPGTAVTVALGPMRLGPVTAQ
jgi:hypothetical protein